MEEKEYEATKLERIRYGLYQQVSRELADELANLPDVDVNAATRWMADQICISIRGAVLGREMERVHCQYPLNWCEAIKERWFPDLLKIFFPVKYVTVDLVARELYPKVALPDKEPVVALSYERNGVGLSGWFDG